MSTLTYTDVIELYVAMFQRAPEKEGASYWYNLATSQNLSKSAVANLMFQSAVDLVNSNTSYQTIYPQYKIDVAQITMDQAKAIINSMYKILFNKSQLEDPEGVNYWADLIANKKISVGDVVDMIINSAKSLVNSPVTETKNAANAFINKVKAAEEISKIIPTFYNNDFSIFQNYIKNVDHQTSTIYTAIEDAQRDYINSATSNFTTGNDNLEGTTGDDFFFAEEGTLNDGDILNTGYGNDVLIAELGGVTVTPTLKYLEEIHIVSKNNSSDLNLGGSNNLLGTLNKIKLYVYDNDSTVSNIPSASVNLVVAGSNDANFKYKTDALGGTSDTVNLTLENAIGNIVLNRTSNEIETINIVSRLGANNLNISQEDNSSNPIGFRGINVSGDAEISGGSLKAKSGADFTLNMSNLNNKISGLSVDLNTAKNVTITGSDYSTGTGTHEDITLKNNATGNVTVNTGKGIDKVTLDGLSPIELGNSTNKNNSIKFTLGDGNDKFLLSNQDLTIYGDLEIDAGAGDNEINTNGKKLKLDGTTGYGNLTIKSGAGEDDVTIELVTATAVSGSVNINLGDGGTSSGKQTLTLKGDSGSPSIIAKTTTITTGSGVDDVTITGMVTFNDNVTITTGTGDDTIDLSVATITLGSGKTITINAGGASSSGKDVVKLTGSSASNIEVVVVNKSYDGYVEIHNFDSSPEDKIKFTGFSGLSVDNSDFKAFTPSSTPSDYTNTSEVLSKLNGQSSSSIGIDDNIIVLKDSSSNSYIYYYKDANSNGQIDTNDTLKLLAKVVGVDLTGATLTDIFTT